MQAKKDVIIELDSYPLYPRLLQLIELPGPHHFKGIEWETNKFVILSIEYQNSIMYAYYILTAVV